MRAAHRPTGSAISHVMNSAGTVRTSVFRARSHSSGATGARCASDRPKSPRATEPSHCAKRTGGDSVSPCVWRRLSTVPADTVASIFRSSKNSPGASSSIVNVSTDTPSVISAPCASRLSTNRSMLMPPPVQSLSRGLPRALSRATRPGCSGEPSHPARRWRPGASRRSPARTRRGIRGRARCRGARDRALAAASSTGW